MKLNRVLLRRDCSYELAELLAFNRFDSVIPTTYLPTGLIVQRTPVFKNPTIKINELNICVPYWLLSSVELQHKYGGQTGIYLGDSTRTRFNV